MQTDVRGLKEFQRMLARIGNLPARSMSKAVRAGAKIEQRAARDKAPVDTGLLRKAIIIKAEKTSAKNKKFMDVTIDRKYNDFFVKKTKKKFSDRKKRKVSLKQKRYYYPASQEYGFFAVNGRYIPGFRYLRDTTDRNTPAIRKVIIDDLWEEIRTRARR